MEAGVTVIMPGDAPGDRIPVFDVTLFSRKVPVPEMVPELVKGTKIWNVLVVLFLIVPVLVSVLVPVVFQLLEIELNRISPLFVKLAFVDKALFPLAHTRESLLTTVVERIVPAL